MNPETPAAEQYFRLTVVHTDAHTRNVLLEVLLSNSCTVDLDHVVPQGEGPLSPTSTVVGDIHSLSPLNSSSIKHMTGATAVS